MLYVNIFLLHYILQRFNAKVSNRGTRATTSTRRYSFNGTLKEIRAIREK